MGKDCRLGCADYNGTTVLEAAGHALEDQDFRLAVHPRTACESRDVVRRARRCTHILEQEVAIVRRELRRARSGPPCAASELIAREDRGPPLKLEISRTAACNIDGAPGPLGNC